MAQLWRAQVSAGVPIWGESNGAGAGSAPVTTDITAAATSIVVTWSGAATHYRINGGATTALPDGTSPDTITGLVANTEYNAPGLQLSGDGGSTWSAAVAFGTTNPGAGGGEINPNHNLQGSPGTSASIGASVAMSYTPPGGAPSYTLQGSGGISASIGASVALSYIAPLGSWNGLSARPFVRGGAIGPQAADYPGSDILRPAEDVLPVDPAERDYIAFDWVDWLTFGEALQSVAITIEAATGDASPTSRLLGTVETYGSRARQWVEGVQAGAWYLMRATGTTTQNGRRIVLAARFKGVREM